MPEDRSRAEWAIFLRVREQPPEQRRASLQEACGDDSQLRRAVEQLLRDEGSAGSHHPSPDLVPTLALGDHGPPGDSLPPGSVLSGRFEIVRHIAAGGMGEVYEARDRELDRHLALKTLLAARANSPAALARFRREIQLAQQVTHRNVCRVFDLVRDGDLVFLTMELLNGETLADRLGRCRTLGRTEVALIVRQVADGLEAAHSVGVIHRDLKPSNVMLVEESGKLRAVVTDFGLATAGSSDQLSADALTRTGEILGTPVYMAPEQLQGGVVSPRTDVYALGLLLFEMVTGERPFGVGNYYSMAHRRLEQDPPSPRQFVPDLDQRWEEIILRCLARDPGHRFAAPREVAGALEEIVAPRPLPAKAPNRTLTLLVAGAAVLALVLAIWLFRPDGSSSRPTPASPVPEQAGATTASSGGPWIHEPDSVLVANFENRTGDPSFDGLLEPALSRALSSSTAVTVVSPARLADALRLMRLPPDTTLDAQLAREVALRDPGVRAVITGTLRQLGDSFVVTSQLAAPHDGAVLGSWSEEAGATAAGVHAALERTALSVRKFLGENVDGFSEGGGRERVTTASLRALQLFQQAEAVIARFGMDSTSEELLRRAIQEDPEFATAYLYLAFALRNQGRAREEYLQHAEKAMSLADGVSDRERYFIRGSYFAFVGDQEKAKANYQALLQLDPSHYWGNNNLALMLGPSGGVPLQVRKAVHRPNDLDAVWDAAHALAIVADRPEEAQPFVDRAVEVAAVEIPPRQEHEAAWARLWRAHRKSVGGDLEGARAELDRWAAKREGQRGLEAWWTARLLVSGYRSLGLVERAEALLPLPEERLTRRYFRGIDAYLGTGELEDSLSGNDWKDRWWGNVLLQDPLRVAALARTGRVEQARQVIEQFRTYRPSPVPEIEESADVLEMLMTAELRLAENQVEEAAQMLEKILRHDWEQYGISFQLAAQALAMAYRQSGRDEEALAVLERAAEERTRAYPYGTELWLETKLRLAQLHRELGNPTEAERIEKELRNLMRLADPDYWLVRRLNEATPAAQRQ